MKPLARVTGCRNIANRAHLAARMVVAGATLLLGPGQLTAQVATAEPEYQGNDRIENWTGKSVLVVTPHPDDETFSAGGTLALLARGGNTIHIVIYTSDNAGSNDPEMTKERLAEIRRAEEEDACRQLGIPPENITWLGYDDGMLEYADARELTKQVAAEIRRYRPDVIFTIDPGAPYEQWHKSDHRAAAMITVDAMRAAAWRLYFPELEAAGLAAHQVPVALLFYSNQPNYTVDIEEVSLAKARAAAAHTSQFGEMVNRYDPADLEAKRERLAQGLLASPIITRDKGRMVEKFRRSTRYGG